MYNYIAAATQLGTAYKQRQESKRMQYQDPTLKGTDAIREKTGLWRGQAQSSRMPGQDLAEAQLGATTARSARRLQESSTDSADIIAGLSDVAGKEMEARNQLAIEGAKNRNVAAQQLGSALTEKAAEEMSIQDLENWKKMQNNLKKDQLLDSSRKNVQAGLKTLADNKKETDQKAMQVFSMMYGGGMGGAMGGAMGATKGR